MMAKARRCDPGKENFWRCHVGRQQSDGMSIRAYCREHSLSEAGFYWWRRELSRREGKGSEHTLSKTFARSFAPIKIVDANRSSTWSQRLGASCQGLAEPKASGVELIVGPSRWVRLERDFDERTLLQVLAVLERAGGC